MQFRNVINGHTVKFNRWVEFITCLVFGTLYFLYRGHYGHALISLILAVLTSGFSWLIYPFFVEKINEAAYLNKGWVKVEDC